MKQNIIQNYSWLDIIEPTQLTPTYSLWEYFAIFILVALILAAAAIYFNLYRKIKFLLIVKKIKRSNFSHQQIKQILKLFYFDTNIEKKLLNKNDKSTYAQQKHILLKTCYSAHPVDQNKINKTLKILWKWL